MKNILCLFLMSLFFVNCNSQDEVKSISTIELKAVLEKDDIQLVDVRTPREIKQGFIDSAIFVNFFDSDFIVKAIQKLDKNKPVYLYCRTGNRSGKATRMLKEKGFEVYNVLGGYNKWKQEN
jgi:rhodanese-related sulfurtransferase